MSNELIKIVTFFFLFEATGHFSVIVPSFCAFDKLLVSFFLSAVS